jgi:hypothetical protein
MAVLRRVTFQFPGDTQIRYVERPPRRGEHVRGLDGMLYVVLHAGPTDSGDIAVCVTPTEYARATRRAPRAAVGPRTRAARQGRSGRA